MISVEKIIETLNDCFKLDPEACNALLNSRVPCNMALAKHPTIQVLCDENYENPTVGLLGILNGFMTQGKIVALFDQDNQQLLGFDYNPNF